MAFLQVDREGREGLRHIVSLLQARMLLPRLCFTHVPPALSQGGLFFAIRHEVGKPFVAQL